MEHCLHSMRELQETHKQGFSVQQIKDIMHDVCSALEFLHKQNIVHMDIKPGTFLKIFINAIKENILYSRTRKYKLADLGLARIAQRSQGEEIEEGDGRYLAAEILNDMVEPMPDLRKADIFSFGMCMYEFAVGERLPTNGDEWHAIRGGEIPKLQENRKKLPQDLIMSIQSMMSLDPNKRPSATQLLQIPCLLSEKDIQLKWEQTQNEWNKEKIKELEHLLQIRPSRRKSF